MTSRPSRVSLEARAGALAVQQALAAFQAPNNAKAQSARRNTPHASPPPSLPAALPAASPPARRGRRGRLTSRNPLTHPPLTVLSLQAATPMPAATPARTAFWRSPAPLLPTRSPGRWAVTLPLRWMVQG